MILVRKLINFYRRRGLAATSRTVMRVLRDGTVAAPLSVDDSLGFVTDRPKYLPIASSEEGFRYSPKRVNIVIPSFGKHSGGHTTIFRWVRLLEQAGIDVEFYLVGQSEFLTESEISRTVSEHYFPLKARFRLKVEAMRPADCVVATEWRTAYAVRDFPNCREKFYFVQDFEPSFFSASSQSVLAEQTYRWGFKCITAGKWLKSVMEGYGNQAVSFDLAYDSEFYRQPPQPAFPPKRVVFYARHVTPRRGFELGILALELLRQRHPDVEIVLYGWKEFEDRVSFPFVNGGVLSHAELAKLYQGARVGLSLSLSNYSLVPQEMLACGLPVVEARLPSVQAAYPAASPGILLTEVTPEALADSLDLALREEAGVHEKRRFAAAALVDGLTWEKSMQPAVEWLREV